MASEVQAYSLEDLRNYIIDNYSTEDVLERFNIPVDDVADFLLDHMDDETYLGLCEEYLLKRGDD